ncbi:hypothetical protein [Pseudomonas sp. MYb185]|uniref:hypothetical protein n=1 Tax=Pseudomonas sp. MYb185 TaxID=1848729 RepID=UPI000CFCBB0E|nr:hypothetical protein [Pseudomonas sp. MYb185]PRB80525.1 hypothetical protein CQ007_12450 [Pseudomonas sp. MYb185]
MSLRDIQSEIIAALQALLAPLGQVEEGDVRSMFDADDDGLPDSIIILQPGDTVELTQQGSPRMPGSLREQVTINLIPATRKRQYAAELRALRLAIKVATAGPKAGLHVQGVQLATFATQTTVPPEPGRRWAFHVMPLQITYVQPLA